jgi:hypothetical protein
VKRGFHLAVLLCLLFAHDVTPFLCCLSFHLLKLTIKLSELSGCWFVVWYVSLEHALFPRLPLVRIAHESQLLDACLDAIKLHIRLRLAVLSEQAMISTIAS